eukprot:13241069-Heterocapsa_arctica.AAC.1
MCIDANARCGSVPCDAIGPCDPDDETENGEALRAVLTTHSMAAANTFVAAGPTWTGSRGHQARIDYVCVPHGLLNAVA